MNEEEIINIAKKTLELEGYENYRIKTVSHPVGTNVWIVESETDSLTIALEMDYDTGTFLRKDEANKIVKISNEGIGIAEKSKAIIFARLFFGLSEPVDVSGVKIDSPNIKIIKAEKNPNSIIGFEVFISDSNNEKIEKAYLEIRRLTNLLSLKLGRYIDHKRPEIFITDKSGKSTGSKSFTIDAILVKQIDLDLNNSNLSSIVNDNDPVLNQQLSDAVSGIKAYSDRNYKDAIKNFWLAIENEKHSLAKDYRSLRDGLSHSEINNDNVQKVLQDDFGLTLKEKNDSIKTPKGVYVDANDPTNRAILKEEATVLRIEVIKILEGKLSL